MPGLLSLTESTQDTSLSLSLSAVPFSELHTSSYTTRGQMYFRWSHSHLSTVPGGHGISITKNVTRGQRGVLRTKSGLCFHLLETPSFVYPWGPRSFWVRENEAVSESQEQRAPMNSSSSNCPTRPSLCLPHRMSDRTDVQDECVRLALLKGQCHHPLQGISRNIWWGLLFGDVTVQGSKWHLVWTQKQLLSLLKCH